MTRKKSPKSNNQPLELFIEYSNDAFHIPYIRQILHIWLYFIFCTPVVKAEVAILMRAYMGRYFTLILYRILYHRAIFYPDFRLVERISINTRLTINFFTVVNSDRRSKNFTGSSAWRNWRSSFEPNSSLSWTSQFLNFLNMTTSSRDTCVLSLACYLHSSQSLHYWFSLCSLMIKCNWWMLWSYIHTDHLYTLFCLS